MTRPEKPNEFFKCVDNYLASEKKEEFTSEQQQYVASEEIIHEYQGNLPPIEVPITPIEHLSFPNLEIIVLGKPENWKDPANWHKLIPFLKENGINTVYVPDCSTFTGRLGDPSDFKEQIEIDGIKFLSGSKCEGIIIPKGCAELILTADCLAGIYHDITNNIVIGFHAGLASLFDKEHIINDASPRVNETIIDDLPKRQDENDYEIFILGGINSNHFIYNVNHSEFGRGNKKMWNFFFEFYGTDAVSADPQKGNINLEGIIMLQLLSFRFKPTEIIFSKYHTYSDPRLHSHKYAVDHGEETGRRNGIIVFPK